jgi:hypothetical protein
MADPDPAAELPHTRVDGGRGQPTADAPARWSAAAAVPPPAPKKRWWPRRPPRPEPVEHTAVDPDDWASIPAVDPWAGMDTDWDPLTEVPLPPTTVEPPRTAVDPPQPPPPPSAAPAPAPAPAPARPPAAPAAPTAAGAPTAAAAPAAAPGAPAPAVASAAVPQPAPKVTWRERLAHRREPIEREVRERAARQGEALQRAAQQQATRVRESMAKAAKTAPPLVSRLPVQRRPSAAPIPQPQRPAAAPTGQPPRPTAAPTGQPPRPTAAPTGQPPRPSWPPPPSAPHAQRPFPAPARNRRRRPRRLLLFVLLLLVGVPLLYERFPAARQYPVSASLPDSFSDLSLRDDNASRKATERLAGQLNADGADSDGVFAGVYGDGHGKRVTVFGVTGWRFTPGSDAQAEINRLAGDFDIDTVTSYDTGVPGVHEFCATGRSDGAAVVVCAWADHGSLAAVLLTRRSQDESAELVGRLRESVLSPQLDALGQAVGFAGA